MAISSLITLDCPDCGKKTILSQDIKTQFQFHKNEIDEVKQITSIHCLKCNVEYVYEIDCKAILIGKKSGGSHALRHSR